MALNIGLIVIACIVPCVLVFANLIIVARYIDSEAVKGHYLAKLMVIFGLLLAECTILLLPLDVGNQSGVVGCGFWNDNCGGLDMTVVWEIVYCIIAALVVIVFPFFIFYYENDDEGMSAKEESGGSTVSYCCNFQNAKRSLGVAFCYTLVTFAISIFIILMMYSYLATTELPYELTAVDVSGGAFQQTGLPIIDGATSCPDGNPDTCLLPCGTGQCTFQPSILEMSVTFIIYLAALISFVGWFIFSIYVGIGFIALPIDCIMSFIHRPKVLSTSEARAQRKVLMNRATELMRIGDDMASRLIDYNDEMHSKKERRKKSKIDSQELNRFRVLVDMLEKDLEDFQLSDPAEYKKHYNPFVPYAKLVFGIVSIIVSAVWIIQMIIYMLFYPPLNPFLNTYLSYFDKFFPLFGTITLAIFGLYLLLAAAKGNFKFGTRFFLIKVHPMELHKTLMNSFIFNVALILLCCLPAVQFCTQAFSQYARLSDAGSIFGSQFQHMKFFSYFWEYNVFIFTILGFALLSIIYFSIFPSDRAHLNKVMQQIKSNKAKERANLEKKINQKGGALSEVELPRKK